MKKRRFISIITVSLFILTLMTGCTSTNDQTTERTQSVNVEDQNSDSSLSTQNDWDDNTDTQTNSSSDLSQDEIRTIIEKHNSDLKGVNMTMELDSDDGIRVYDVTARTSTHKYEYEINASSGDILKYEIELRNPNANTATSGDVITKTQVRSIVEKYTPDLKGQDLNIEQDTDDGLRVYEVEGRTSTHEYDFEINAYSEDILHYSEEVR